MKVASLIVIILAAAMVVFNLTKIDFDAPLKGDSMLAVITIVAALCAILLMVILRISRRIEQKVKERR